MHLRVRFFRGGLAPRCGAPTCTRIIRAGAPPVLKRTFYTSSARDTGDGLDKKGPSIFAPLDTFPHRHIGPSPSDTELMLKALDPPASSLDDFVKQVLPADILSPSDLHIETVPTSSQSEGLAHADSGYSESRLLMRLRAIASKNKVFRSYIGCGYAGTRVPEVIKRNVLEGPGWYTSYTPYQPEISQGRLESLLNFQTMVTDLTGMDMANASVLDESTAAAEAMTMAMSAASSKKQKRPTKAFFVSHLVHPQTIAVLRSRAEGFGIQIKVGNVLANGSKEVEDIGDDLLGVLVQYPDTEGGIEDFNGLSDIVHKHGGLLTVGTDLLALTVLTPPGEFGADVTFGNSQRFGVPFGFGGPHAAFFATTDKVKRKMPGRLIGLSKDRLGDPAARLALQTREQHIRREKATSNICTAQALLANMSAFYAVYHGPQGLRNIAERTITIARVLQQVMIQLGYKTGRDGENKLVEFDTLVVKVDDAQKIAKAGVSEQAINFRVLDEHHIGITVDETVDKEDIVDIISVFAGAKNSTTKVDIDQLASKFGYSARPTPSSLRRTSKYLTHPVFNTHHSETELLRYIHHLQSKDLSLTHSMIPLGSCTMKLNSTTEMIPVTWPEFSQIHPFVPIEQAEGYKIMIDELEKDLAVITGFDAVSLQPNSGAQGEFAGLVVIREYLKGVHKSGGKKRDVCIIPVSAHGTNPASATMAGMRVVPIKCNEENGNLDMEDLQAKCEKHKDELAAIMITYPSTFGVFEPKVKEACDLVHKYGGQVYMDGANMNAQIGLCSPGEIGADVCHLNLHKTFCIPHGGGGPGVGPIGVKSHLAPYLPGHPLTKTGGERAIAPISGAPWGSASILPISWAYIKMMGGLGLTHATKITLLNANYILARLKPHFKILYTNDNDRCAHEFILDVRPFLKTADVGAIDIAKRLQDYGFHAPTMSWPVPNTLMIEPTESESKEELDRFCDALIQIRKEISEVEKGEQPKENNVLKLSPHTVKDLLRADWDRQYSRETAAYPLPYLKEKKFWPSVTRLDDGRCHRVVLSRMNANEHIAYGDLNLFCSCSPVQEGITGMEAPAPT